MESPGCDGIKTLCSLVMRINMLIRKLIFVNLLFVCIWIIPYLNALPSTNELSKTITEPFYDFFGTLIGFIKRIRPNPFLTSKATSSRDFFEYKFLVKYVFLDIRPYLFKKMLILEYPKERILVEGLLQHIPIDDWDTKRFAFISIKTTESSNLEKVCGVFVGVFTNGQSQFYWFLTGINKNVLPNLTAISKRIILPRILHTTLYKYNMNHSLASQYWNHEVLYTIQNQLYKSTIAKNYMEAKIKAHVTKLEYLLEEFAHLMALKIQDEFLTQACESPVNLTNEWIHGTLGSKWPFMKHINLITMKKSFYLSQQDDELGSQSIFNVTYFKWSMFKILPNPEDQTAHLIGLSKSHETSWIKWNREIIVHSLDTKYLYFVLWVRQSCNSNNFIRPDHKHQVTVAKVPESTPANTNLALLIKLPIFDLETTVLLDLFETEPSKLVSVCHCLEEYCWAMNTAIVSIDKKTKDRMSTEELNLVYNDLMYLDTFFETT